jgi:hypothetical protein
VRGLDRSPIEAPPREAGTIEPMKIVMATIKPSKLDEVRDARTKIGIQGLTVIEAKGDRRRRGGMGIERGVEPAVGFRPGQSRRACAAESGHVGDGRICGFGLDRAAYAAAH